MILAASLFLDFLQYISTGPDFRDISQLLTEIGNAASVDLEDFVNMKEGVFWFFVNGALGLTGLMICLYVFNTFCIR
jgi:hypothetical protein